MKSKELKVYNLPNDSFFITEICAKPTILFLIMIFIGLLSLIISDIKVVYGIMMIVTGFICVCFLPRVVLIEFYNDYMILYNRADKNICFIIYYEEISSWYYTWGTSRDYLVIELMDGSIEKIEAFSKPIFEGSMLRFVKDKHMKNV